MKNNNNIVYHISNGVYEDLRAAKFQINNKDAIKRVTDNYYDDETGEIATRSISLFLDKLTNKNVVDLIENGFENYSSENLYLYTIDLNKNIDTIDSIEVTSTKEQDNYDNEHWSPDGKPEDEFILYRKEYQIARSKYLMKYGFDNRVTLSEYLSNTRIQKIKDNYQKSIKFNIEHGSKYQYATYIPHLLVVTKGPIVYESVVQIYSKYSKPYEIF